MHDIVLFLLDDEGTTVESRKLTVRDDLEALLEAERACADNTVEVWEGPRRVLRVKQGNTPLLLTDRTSL